MTHPWAFGALIWSVNMFLGLITIPAAPAYGTFLAGLSFICVWVWIIMSIKNGEHL